MSDRIDELVAAIDANTLLQWDGRDVALVAAHELATIARDNATKADSAIQEARIWKQEALAQRSTVYAVYEICTEKTGEPGDWNGAEPVRALKAERDALLAEHEEKDAALAAYIGARNFDDGCLCTKCVSAINSRLEDAHELLQAAREAVIHGE
jgi:hypothetical protein